jgi:hypothetical protein
LCDSASPNVLDACKEFTLSLNELSETDVTFHVTIKGNFKYDSPVKTFKIICGYALNTPYLGIT